MLRSSQHEAHHTGWSSIKIEPRKCGAGLGCSLKAQHSQGAPSSLSLESVSVSVSMGKSESKNDQQNHDRRICSPFLAPDEGSGAASAIIDHQLCCFCCPTLQPCASVLSTRSWVLKWSCPVSF